ncbi:MAG: PKD domain-containing protein, partial [Planctomycetota bacterium]|nr:PKD domain-containing protein [Planctomycetota bacterium]
VGNAIRITGYGTVTAPVSATWNVVNKTHAGSYVTTGGGGTGLGYNADTTGGNSGSPIICDISGLAIGIHTHGGCSASGGNNWGTSLTNAGFQAMWTSSGAPTPPAGVCATPSAPSANFTSSNPSVLQGSTVSFSDTSTGGPSSWAWDLNGDGTTDSTLPNPTFTYNTPGSYTVSLTVSNAFGSNTNAMPGYVTVSALTAATLPVTEPFTAGLPTQGSSGWVFSSSNSFGAITAGQSGVVSPNSGGNALTMSSNTSGNFVQNDATLVIDLAAAGGATLSYWIKETGDEDDPQDGLWISDGANEALVQAHTGLFISAAWTQYTVDLDQAATANGIAITSTFRVIWRQYDNFVLGTDGHLIDDVDIQPDSQFSLALSSTGGNLFCDLQNLPTGTVQGFTLFSFNTTLPVGLGNIYGINADLMTFQSIASPGAPGNIFHWVLPAPPFLYPNAPFVLPPGSLNSFVGMTADGQGLALGAGFNLLGTTNVVRTTLTP